MATHQLGPETPRPFSVLSERHVKDIAIPDIPSYELFSFGIPYETKMMELIHRYLELGTDDSLCYVGPEQGSLAPLIQDKFCLLEPVTTVNPGLIHYHESASHKMVPFHVPHVGAEEYFRSAIADGTPSFSKVLLRDALPYLSNPRDTYGNIMGCMRDGGKLLIIHRPAPINTLPISREASSRMLQDDQSYMDIIQDLQTLYYDVQWEIECLPIVLPKKNWFAMLHSKFPPQLEGVSSYDVRAAIRELSEGVLKYEGDTVEFVDRLLFISASISAFTDYPSIQRFGARTVQPFPGLQNLHYNMEVTPDLKPFISERSVQDRNREAMKERRSELGIR